jgi:hypothetical protein
MRNVIELVKPVVANEFAAMSDERLVSMLVDVTAEMRKRHVRISQVCLRNGEGRVFAFAAIMRRVYSNLSMCR